MSENAKRSFLWICKWLGLFQLARFVTRRGLRIICYHGFALSDESSFRPRLFMKPETFQVRMKYLAAHNYPVLSLERACDALAKGSLPDCAVVITIDDGFYSVFREAWPVLQRHSLTATVYVTSYYAQKGSPIFRLAVQYMFWKTVKNELDTTDLRLPLSGVVPLRPDKQKDETMWEIIRFAETRLEEPERCVLASELGKRLGVEYASLEETRGLGLMSAEEIRDLAMAGMDVQLHTHRHQLPEEQSLVAREIQQNRQFLEPLTGKKLQHLCYPSGVWSEQRWPWLHSLGIISATTCDSGLNYPQTPHLGLQRFLDAESIVQIEFEAELTGFSQLLRSARSALRRS
jgi:peptidoglycan/xylan/chitin deacetylase (PgdA/CDA1 family)